MMKTKTFAIIALLAGALILPGREALANGCCDGGLGKPVIYALSSLRMKGWIGLHRPDGELVHINIDQIVFVMSAANIGANTLARARVQTANGFADVLESVDEVMRAIKDGDSIVGLQGIEWMVLGRHSGEGRWG
jgi:hypothetical protein